METPSPQLRMEQWHVKEIQNKTADTYEWYKQENTQVKMGLGTSLTTRSH